MSDLNDKIAAWRDSLAAQLSAAEIDELEDHLREGLETLSEAPLSLEEQFLIATQRMGAPRAIVEEFEKANPWRAWRERFLWIFFGYVGLMLFSLLYSYPIWVITVLTDNQDAYQRPYELALHAVGIIGMLFVVGLVTTLTGDGRSARRGKERLARMPGAIKGAILGAVALTMLGTPGGLAAVVLSYSNYKHLDPWRSLNFAFDMYRLAFGNVVMNFIVVIGLIALAPWLAGQRRHVAAEQ